MIAWINFVTLILGGGLMTTLYLMSVRPAALEKKIGPEAYKRCGRYRLATSIFMFTLTANYILYHWYPLPFDPFPASFPWPYWVSVVIAVIIAIPSLYLEVRSSMDAKTEALLPDKSHTLYKGIYEKIRHPMALGEVPLWWVIAFLVNSPFLVVFSFVWIPVWYWWCVAEERDLALRYGEAYETYRKQTGMFFPKRNAAE
ncbi:MAG: isoprenylcysteine carboxylmethyltransferase family protein [Anaerolineales bacterium]|nr:isoprenylcysteine carboxylmethyltransferase family protein [Anaerolineales bacterium]